MTVLVLGATGNVGGALAEAPADRGTAVRAVSRRQREWPAVVRRHPEGESPVVPTVEQVLGRPAVPLAGWVHRHRDELEGRA